jgi:hypothetical protein
MLLLLWHGFQSPEALAERKTPLPVGAGAALSGVCGARCSRTNNQVASWSVGSHAAWLEAWSDCLSTVLEFGSSVVVGSNCGTLKLRSVPVAFGLDRYDTQT